VGTGGLSVYFVQMKSAIELAELFEKNDILKALVIIPSSISIFFG
jgi:hypothetical protein